ncbi:hypothetical protein [Falsiroseomonas oryzae]|uniref:hypothetical protein n=1 Tax=Falsiroseomonas oryzae TaxID=2766473 RepID=UPI0022EA614A|nr:hypothetical protein [Roseomonas sp. MO-31]
MSLNLASDCLAMPAESTRSPALRRGMMHLLAFARRLRPTGVIRARIGSERLSAADLRDVGLQPDQVGQVPIWGHGGLVWRP